MSKSTLWEYRIRVITDGQLGDQHALGKGDVAKQTVVEAALNDLVKAGWEVMPMSLQTRLGAISLVLRKQAVLE